MFNSSNGISFTFKKSNSSSEKVKKINGVIGAVNRGGEYQIIIGMDVVHVANAIKAQGTSSADAGTDAPDQQPSPTFGDNSLAGATSADPESEVAAFANRDGDRSDKSA